MEKYIAEKCKMEVGESDKVRWFLVVLAAALHKTSAAFLIQKRTITDEVVEEDSKQSWFDWFFRPVPEKVVTEAETKERTELLERVQACYYKKPPEEPGIEHFEEAFNLLMKYEDWRSVEALWRLAEAQHLEFDDDLLDKIEDFLLESRQKRWFE